MRLSVVVLAVALLVTLAPVTAGETVDDTGQVADECAPPCGEINPRITFEFSEMADEPIPLEQGDSMTFEGEVVYWTDTDDEGHAPSDPTQDIVIRFSFPRLPTWATMSLEPNEVTVPVDTCPTCFQTDTDGDRPATNYEFRQAIELTVTAEEPPEATTGYDYGKLQLFAKSTESGIYNPGYGIREIRVQPAGGEALDQQSTDEFTSVPSAGALASLSALAAVALAVRARR